SDFEEVGIYFKKLINLLKQMNYSPFESPDFKKYEAELDETVHQKSSPATKVELTMGVNHR
ncbi:MAG: hypothetical protein AAF223_15580, partial [Bacteroidota bacterium]